MLDAPRRPTFNAALIGVVLLLITVLDLVLPGRYLVAALYAFPMLYAALSLQSRGTTVTALVAVVLVSFDALIRQPPAVIGLLGVLGTCAIGGLAIQLSRQRRRVVSRSIEREEARRQVTEILESIGDGFFALDDAGRFTYVNQQAEQFLGCDREAVVGQPAWECFPEETRAAFKAATDQCSANLQPAHVETYDSTQGKWYEVHVYPSMTGLSLYFRDTTVRKRAEEGRRAAEAKYRSLVEQVPAITYRVEKRLGEMSAETVAEYISPQLESMLGYKVNDWLSNPALWTEHLHPDDRERVLRANERANRTGRPLRVEYRLIAADGGAVWVRDQASLVAPEEAGHRTWQGIIFDVTAEKEAEAARAESAGKFAFLAETSRLLTAAQLDYGATLKQIAKLFVPQLADWAIVYLVDGKTIHRTALAFGREADSRLAERFDAVPVSVLTQAPIRNMLEGGRVLYLPTLEDAEELFELLSAEEAELVNDMQLRSVILMPVRARGHLLGALLLARHIDSPVYTRDDVSFIEEVVHRFALVLDNARLYQEARDALSAREEFFAVAAHELRTPLTTLKGYIQLLERRLNRGPQSIETVRQTLDNLRPQLTRFERIVEDLLEVTRIDRNQLSMYRHDCDLAEIASNAFNALRDSEARVPSQPMRLTVPDSLRGYWDATRIAQVIENLLSNALRYSLGRGEVELRIERRGDVALISIRDQGIGLSREEQQRVFEPFFRGDALAGRVEGSGLGLAITKRIVEQHGGTVSVESVVDQGTTFTVQLPINPTSRVPASAGLVEQFVEL